MEELDFNSLFEASSNDYAGDILERLFGGIIPFLKGEAASPGSNFLSEMFTIFNMIGFLGVLIVSSYTVYTVIFDTAADGKTFGQNADTKYTLMRILGGAIAFIPVTGGYSVAQVVLLYLMIQASALGDVVWSRTAEASLRNEPLLSTPSNTTLADIMIQRQFANAFDALVMGHICAYNANDIKLTLDGTGPGEPGGNRAAGPMTLRVTVPSESRDHTNWFGADTGRVDLTRTHNMFFATDDDDSSFGQRDNFCGGVSHSVTIENGGDPTGLNFNEAIVTVQRNARFDSYQTVMGTLAGRAADIAWRVFNDERDVQTLEELSRAAVQEAVNGYLAGVQSTNSIPESALVTLNENLIDRASEGGWLFAPSWQRGIAIAASNVNSVSDDFTISVDRQFAITDYLSRGERRSDIGRSMLNMAEDDRATWELMTNTIASLGEEGSAESYNPLHDPTSGANADSLLSRVYQWTLGLLSVRGGAQLESALVTDPMVDIANYGQSMMMIGGATMAVGGAADLAMSRTPMGAIVGAGGGDQVAKGLIGIGWGFIVVGFIIAFIIPLLPFAYFYSAVVSWFLLILEAFFAVPLAVLSLFAPAREGTLIGSWNKILLSIFGILLRPFFTIVGMIVSMMVISFALSYLYDMFYGMVSLVTPNGILGFISLLGFLIMFMLLTFYTVLLGSSLITELGDAAMNWLGIGISSLSQRMGVGDAVSRGGSIQGVTTRQVSDLRGGLPPAIGAGWNALKTPSAARGSLPSSPTGSLPKQ